MKGQSDNDQVSSHSQEHNFRGEVMKKAVEISKDVSRCDEGNKTFVQGIR